MKYLSLVNTFDFERETPKLDLKNWLISQRFVIISRRNWRMIILLMHTKQHFFKIATNKNSKNYDLGGKNDILTDLWLSYPRKLSKLKRNFIKEFRLIEFLKFRIFKNLWPRQLKTWKARWGKKSNHIRLKRLKLGLLKELWI